MIKMHSRFLLETIAVAIIGILFSGPARPQANAQHGLSAVKSSKGPAVEIIEYQNELSQYRAAREVFRKATNEYWQQVAAKRKQRFEIRAKSVTMSIDNFILSQPPVYAGPLRPKPPASLKEKEETAPSKKYVPVISDFLSNAASEFHFIPDRPLNELEFKKAYAAIARQVGLTKDQIVRIYAFETGGNGRYDLQAGFESDKPTAHAISTALGYNQLLHVNTIELLAEKGDRILLALQAKLIQVSNAGKKSSLENKILILQRMIEYSRSVPDDWAEHAKLANTPKGLGIHSLNLDIDVGPILQAENLASSAQFAVRKGVNRHLTAAELEMMNLAGDGSGFDMVVMPDTYRDQVPTSNFFDRDGYEANPTVVENNTVARLLAAVNAQMDEGSMAPGAMELASAF